MADCIMERCVPRISAITPYRVVRWNPPMVNGQYPFDGQTIPLNNGWNLRLLAGLHSMGVNSNPYGGTWSMYVGTYHEGKETTEYSIEVCSENVEKFQRAVLYFNIMFGNNKDLEMEDVIWLN
jgi:hypothetical protein